MTRNDAQWDGQRWVSADGEWVWDDANATWRPLFAPESVAREFITKYRFGGVWVEGDYLIWTDREGEKRYPLRDIDLKKNAQGVWYVFVDGLWRFFVGAKDQGALQRLRDRLVAIEGSRTRTRAKASEIGAGATKPQVAHHERLRVEVKRYKAAKEFERDARRRMADGWTIQGQSQSSGKTHRVRNAARGSVAGLITGFPLLGLVGAGAGTLVRSQGQDIVVTWVRGE